MQLSAGLLTLLAPTSLTCIFFNFFLLASLLFSPYPKDTTVSALLNCLAALFRSLHCSVLASRTLRDAGIRLYPPATFYWKSLWKESMLNGRHVIPARSVVSAALFRLEFVFNVVALILGLCCRRPVSDNQHMVLV